MIDRWKPNASPARKVDVQQVGMLTLGFARSHQATTVLLMPIQSSFTGAMNARAQSAMPWLGGRLPLFVG